MVAKEEGKRGGKKAEHSGVAGLKKNNKLRLFFVSEGVLRWTKKERSREGRVTTEERGNPHGGSFLWDPSQPYTSGAKREIG